MKTKLWQWYSEHDKRWRYRVEGQKVDNPYTPVDRELVVLFSMEQLLGLLDAAGIDYSDDVLREEFRKYILSTEDNYDFDVMEKEGYKLFTERREWEDNE